jgi:hypothetical protein
MAVQHNHPPTTNSARYLTHDAGAVKPSTTAQCNVSTSRPGFRPGDKFNYRRTKQWNTESMGVFTRPVRLAGRGKTGVCERGYKQHVHNC